MTSRPRVVAVPLVMMLCASTAWSQPRRPPRDPAPTPTPAPEGGDRIAGFRQSEARQHFQTGVQHYQAERYTQAIEEFNIAYRTFASPVILFNLGQAYRSDGQLSNAVRTFRQYLDEAPNLSETQRQDVQNTIDEIEHARAVLSFEVEPSGAEVRLDGRPLGTAPLARGSEVLPGTHDIEITLADHETRRETIVVHEHEQRLYTTTLRPVAQNARVVINVTPADAVVSLDGREVGHGTATERVEPGEHRVEAVLDGFVSRTTPITVRPLSTETVTFSLEPRPRPLYTRPWFWIAIGGAVAVTATLLIVLNPSDPVPVPGNGTPQTVQSIVSW